MPPDPPSWRAYARKRANLASTPLPSILHPPLRLAAQKKAAWDKWSANGRPKEGTLYEAKIRTRADFRKRLRVCVANSERRRIQHFDKQFKQRSSNRFKLPSRRKQQGTALRVNQQVTTEQGTILKAWESHFQEISFN